MHARIDAVLQDVMWYVRERVLWLYTYPVWRATPGGIDSCMDADVVGVLGPACWEIATAMGTTPASMRVRRMCCTALPMTRCTQSTYIVCMWVVVAVASSFSWRAATGAGCEGASHA